MLRPVECTTARCRLTRDVLVEVRMGHARVNNNKVSLSNQERALLSLLVSKAGQIVTIRMLLNALYPEKKQAQQKIIDVVVCKIRTKLRAFHPAAGDVIRTVRGRGIAFEKPAYRSIPIQNVELPPACGIWIPKQKVTVLHAIESGRITQRQVLNHYPDISLSEIEEWRRTFLSGGIPMMRNKHSDTTLLIAA